MVGLIASNGRVEDAEFGSTSTANKSYGEYAL